MALSQLDQIKKFEAGTEKIRQSIPMDAYDPSDGAAVTAAATPRPAVSAQPVVPKRALGEIYGNRIRNNVNTVTGVAEGVANMSVLPARNLGGFVRDAYKGFTGGANPRSGLPVAAHFDFGRFSGGGSPSVGSSRRGGKPMNLGSAAVAATPAAVPAPSPAAAPATPVANAVQNNGLPAGITRTVGPDGNPIYTGTGASVAAAGGPPQGSTVVMPQRTLPQEVVAPANQAGQYQARGRQGGIIENPANGSVADQITRAMGSPSLKGSPSARAAVANAIMQQAGFANAERQSALQAGDQADLQNLNNAARANENFADRRLEASKFNVESADARTQNAATNSQAMQIVRGLDGTSSVVRRDGSLSGLTNADGTAFRMAPENDQRTTVSPDAEFKALSEELASLNQMPSEEGSARATQIQQRMAQLTGQGAQGGNQQFAYDKSGKRYTRNAQGAYVDDNGNPYKAQ